MKNAFSIDSTNPHIAALKQVFDDKTTPIQCLVISHNDHRLVDTISSALAGQPAGILQLSQDRWDIEHTVIVETIEWALQQSEITSLLLVGSSQPAGPSSQASSTEVRIGGKARDGHDRLLAGVQRHGQHCRNAQDQFAEYVQQISQIPVVYSRCREGELTVNGLFYRCESGLFLVYDVEMETYRPLLVETTLS